MGCAAVSLQFAVVAPSHTKSCAEASPPSATTVRLCIRASRRDILEELVGVVVVGDHLHDRTGERRNIAADRRRGNAGRSQCSPLELE